MDVPDWGCIAAIGTGIVGARLSAANATNSVAAGDIAEAGGQAAEDVRDSVPSLGLAGECDACEVSSCTAHRSRDRTIPGHALTTGATVANDAGVDWVIVESSDRHERPRATLRGRRPPVGGKGRAVRSRPHLEECTIHSDGCSGDTGHQSDESRDDDLGEHHIGRRVWPRTGVMRQSECRLREVCRV